MEKKNPLFKIWPFVRSRLPLFIIVFLFIWELPIPYIDFDHRLDGSWMIGIYLAFDQGLLFGRDIVFTFGPLGFLWNPLPVEQNLYRLSLLFNLLIHGLFFASLYLFLKRIEGGVVPYLFLAVTFGFLDLNIGCDIKLVFSATLFAYFALHRENLSLKGKGVLAISGILLGLGAYIKLNILPLALFLFFSFPLALILAQKSWTRSLWLILPFGLSFPLVAWALGYSPSQLLDYLYHSWIITSHFPKGMAAWDDPWQVVVAVAVLLSLLGLFISFIKRKTARRVPFSSSGLSLPLPFLNTALAATISTTPSYFSSGSFSLLAFSSF